MEFIIVFTACLGIAAAGIVIYDFWKMKQDDKKF